MRMKTNSSSHESPDPNIRDISLHEVGFQVPDISLEELGFNLPSISLSELEHKHEANSSRRHKTARLLGTGLLTMGTLAGTFAATTVAQETFMNNDADKTEQSTSLDETSPNISAGETEAVSGEQEQLPYLHVTPKESFLTPEGGLADPDYILRAETIGSTIYGYVRPSGESKKIGTELNATPIDVVTPAIVPQIMTPDLEEYARNNPDFIPTLERGSVRGKANSYWNGKAAGEYQKTAMQEYQYSLPPGLVGNSVFLTHASTRSAGGGDFPALKVEGEGAPLHVESPFDGNNYLYRLAEVEIIDVDENGNLTPQEMAKQVAKGHREGVSAYEVINKWAGHEQQATLTVQTCGDEAGVPGGTNGKNAKEARIVYRFILDMNGSTINTWYSGMPEHIKTV